MGYLVQFVALSVFKGCVECMKYSHGMMNVCGAISVYVKDIRPCIYSTVDCMHVISSVRYYHKESYSNTQKLYFHQN